MRGWIAMAFGGKDNPYPDEPSAAYVYDSYVQNHKQVAVGDLLFVRNRYHLEGVGRIMRIDEGSGEKTLLRCPRCGSSRVRFRKSVEPAYRCHSGHLFSDPHYVAERVTIFKAAFLGNYQPVAVKINAAELRPFNLKNTGQLALMPADLDGICAYLARRDRSVVDKLIGWAPSLLDDLEDEDADESPELTPAGLDERARILRAIRQRRGQREFRQSLMTRYHGRCVISGCGTKAVLEAAHIRPYRGARDNHPSNGILLRSDLHTLFDLNRIGIHPDKLTIVLHPELNRSDYSDLSGKRLRVERKLQPDKTALQMRWDEFERRIANSYATSYNET